jgi:glycerate-2-kinase
LILNESATFYYGLSAQNEDGLIGETLTQGNLSMSGDDYKDWLVDNDAWDYIAKSLNLVITGDYIAPVIQNTELS